MREKGILFNSPMVRAILEGRKTQTRRMMKPQPELRLGGFWHWKDCQWKDGGLGFPKTGIEDHAPYQPGDRLWVRETFAVWGDDFGNPVVEYRADTDDKTPATGSLANRWTPNIHMPRAASRITLEVTDVLAEQVQSISVADALAEGLWKCDCGCGTWSGHGGMYQRTDPIAAYQTLWDGIYGPGSWESNPWVWVISFKVLEVKK